MFSVEYIAMRTCFACAISTDELIDVRTGYRFLVDNYNCPITIHVIDFGLQLFLVSFAMDFTIRIVVIVVYS